VDLSQLLRKVHGMAEGKFREEGITLALETNHALPPVECDAEMIHSVVMDLLSNGLDACSWKQYGKGEAPRVSVRLTPAALEGYVDIEVTDNGEGMTEEVKARAFTPFFSTKKKAGTGMGLAVVARIVSSHGGKTTVESEPGKGAAFHVLLPIKVPGLREEEDDG
jgi:signal transduction histidine kinase